MLATSRFYVAAGISAFVKNSTTLFTNHARRLQQRASPMYIKHRVVFTPKLQKFVP